jgi:hypothetical protein
MDINQLIIKKEQEFKENKFIQFSDKVIEQFRINEIEKIIAHFKGHTLMKLPPSEIEFFNWLKNNDNAVWIDIWGEEDNLYLVSVDFLKQFLKEKNGFPICDLENKANYYFTVKHIKPDGLAQMEKIILKTERNEKLDIDELLLFELHIAPIDIWHFCYRYKLPLADIKNLVSDMVFKNWIVHLPESEDLLKYIDI